VEVLAKTDEHDLFNLWMVLTGTRARQSGSGALG
jgi:hypothetical protein